MAGGYATRLWPLTKHIPKALLPIAGKPIIDFILEQISLLPEVQDVIITTNRRFENHFTYWLRGARPLFQTPIRLFIEETWEEAQKPGAIGSLSCLIESDLLRDDDLLVIAGDNLFEFRLSDFTAFFKERGQPAVAFCDLEDKTLVRNKYGVGVLNQNGRLVGFEEKPENPQGTLAATGCYLFPAFVKPLFQSYLDKNNPDAPGHFIAWLCDRTNVHGFVFDEPWFDIGSLESYDLANEHYRDRIKI